MHPHTFLRTQIRNILREWQQNQGSTAFILASQKTGIATSAWELKWQGLTQKAHWRSPTSCRKVWWLDNGRSQSPQWVMWIAALLQSGLDEKWLDGSMECYCFLQNVQDLLADGETPYERRFGEPNKGPIIPCGAMTEHHPISPKGQARIHQFSKKVLPGIFQGYELIARGIWKGDILIADLEDLEKLDASHIYPERIIAKEVLISPKKGDEFIFPVADGTAKLSRRDHDFQEPTLRREHTVRSDTWSI